MPLLLRRRSRAAPLLTILAALAASACKGSPSTPTTSPQTLLGVSVSAASVPGGTSLTGTVTLSAAAPSEGAIVSLATSDASAIVPASVTVAAGATSQTFDIQTTSLPTSVSVALTATYAGGSVVTTFTIGKLALQRLSLAASSVPSGGTVIGSITLTGPAPPDGVQVLLASDSAVARVPASVSIPHGDTGQIFEISTVDATTTTNATITATLHYSGSTKTASLTVARLAVKSVGFGIDRVPGGLPLSGWVTMTVAAPTGGVTVTLASSSAAAIVPPTIAIPEGATTQTFDLTTANTPPTTTVRFTAAYASSSQVATLTIFAYPVVSGLSCSPATAVGGTPVTCTGALTAPAPEEGWQLAISTNDEALAGAVPARITVPASRTTFTFDVVTAPVPSVSVVTMRVIDVPSGQILFSKALSITPS